VCGPQNGFSVLFWFLFFLNYYDFGSGLFGYIQNWKNCRPKRFPEEQTVLTIFNNVNWTLGISSVAEMLKMCILVDLQS